MKTVSIHDAKTNLSKYIAAAKKGEKIYIGSHGNPEVELIIATKPKNRKFGRLNGKLWVAEDFEETPQQLLESVNSDIDENTN